jgi:hypothetical protein
MISRLGACPSSTIGVLIQVYPISASSIGDVVQSSVLTGFAFEQRQSSNIY